MRLADQVKHAIEAARRRRRLEAAVVMILRHQDRFGGAIGRWAAALLAARSDERYPLLFRVVERGS
jgi:hypothetical protein